MDAIAIISLLSVAVTVLLAFINYWMQKQQELELARRKERLELIDRMINQFYGPLYIATRAGERAHKSLKDKLGKTDLFPPNELPNERVLAEWRTWVQSVFVPLNQVREDVILHNAHLIRETELPQCLLDFIAHASAYKAMVAKWNNGHTSEYIPILGFPKEIAEYSERSYLALKAEQAELIGLLKR